MLRRCVIAVCVLCSFFASAHAVTVWQCPVEGKEIVTYDTETLYYRIRQLEIEGTQCYLTEISLEDPSRQISKVTARWQKDLAYPSELAKKRKDAALVINGSGYVSPVFPWIPENYPGKSSDYYYTPLGSLTVTDSVIYRNLEGVPYYGLTLEPDGLHLYVDVDNESVLAKQPLQTWSFYIQCPLIQDGESILDRDWDFANAKAMRTIIGQLDAQHLFVLTVSRHGGGLSLLSCTDWILDNIAPAWAYDLDGGPSSALLYRKYGSRVMKTAWGNGSKDADIMVFSELPSEEIQAD